MSVRSDPTWLGSRPSPSSDATSFGEEIAGFRVVGKVGRGAQSVVYHVRRDDVDYALKWLAPSRRVPADVNVAFRREAALVASVRHPGLCQIHEISEVDGRPYLVMDLVEGRQLGEVLATGPISPDRAVRVAMDLAGALAELHRRGLVHRDVKPQNVMMLASGEARLIDFGFIAREDHHDDQPVVGTLDYAPPEQSGILKRPVDARSDLYSLGVLLFECLTGGLPFISEDLGELLRLQASVTPPDLRSLVPDAPTALAGVVAGLLAKDPDDRYQSGEDLIGDLLRIRDDPATVFRPTTGRAGRQVRIETSFNGRSQELASLGSRWARATEGEGGACLVRGAPGAGKSRLVRELARVVRGRGGLVLSGKSAPDDAAPLAPLRQAVAAHLHLVQTFPEGKREAAMAALRSVAGQAAPLLSALSPELGEVLEAGALAEDGREDQFISAVAAFLADLATVSGGLFLHLDDVQWLDQATRAVLLRLASSLSSVPLLVVATARDDADSGETTHRFETALDRAIDLRLTLGPLDQVAVASLVASVLPGANVESRITRLLTIRGNGNPFLILEYLRAVLDAGLLRPFWGTWLFDEAGLDALVLPQDSLGLVLARIEGLGPDHLAVLRTAAAMGIRFRPDTVARTCKIKTTEVLELMAQAAARSLVEVRNRGEYGFVHDRVREALLHPLAATETAQLHSRIAEALDATPRADAEHVFALAHHCIRGEVDPRLLFQACVEAGRLALDSHAATEAVMFLAPAAATGLAVDGVFLRLYGTALEREGHHVEAVEQLEQALALESAALGRAALYAQIARIHRGTWNGPAAAAAIERGLAELDASMPTRLPILMLSSLVLFFVGLVIGAFGWGFGTASGDQRERYRLMSDLHNTACAIWRIDFRRELVVAHTLRLVLPVNRVGPASPQFPASYAGFALALAFAGKHRVSRAAFDRARNANAALGDPRLAASIAWHEGWAAFMGGLDDGERLAQAIGEHERWLPVGLFCDGSVALCWESVMAGDTANAVHWHEQGRRRLAAGQEKITSTVTSGLMTRSLMGRFAKAGSELHRVQRALADRPGLGLRSTLLLGTVHALVEQGEFGDSLEAAMAEFRQLGNSPPWMLRPHRAFYALHTFVRLAQCRSASDTERPQRREAARAALVEFRKAANTRLLRGYERVATADLLVIDGRGKPALRVLGRVQESRPEPLVAYEIARVRARAFRALGDHRESTRQALHAQQIAIQQEWPHRARWLTAEFGAGKLRAPMWTAAGSPRTPRSCGGLDHQRLQALEAVSLAASHVLGPEQLTRIALDETIRILAADRAVLFLTNDQDTEIVAHAARDASGHDIPNPTGYSASLVERVRSTRDVVVIAGTEEGAALGAHSVVLHDLRSILIAPLLFKDRLLGVVYLDSRLAKGVFTADDASILSALTHHVATALETARAAQLEVSVQVARRQRDLAETMRTALSKMSATLDVAEVLAALLDATVRILPCREAWLLTVEDGYLTGIRAGSGPDEPAADNADIDRAGGTGTVWPVDAEVDALLGGKCPVTGQSPIRPPGALARVANHASSWIALPLSIRALELGVILLVSDESDAYQETEIEVAAALVAQGMSAYQNAHLFARVQESAIADELTRVANRRHFFDLADQALATARAESRPLIVMMVDIDHFKRVNDTHGHGAGDDVIRAVAERLSAALRPKDIVGRYGGEEFAIVVADSNLRVAERLRARIAETPISARSGQISVTVSVGATKTTPTDDSIAVPLARADKALYQAKTGGRNRVGAI
ncbi:MAG: diguanylate cyclase [Dactylosporangium sp.]|nr:diguanylate cyclase [Dactylosporangium sp.]NNJ61884.1 diguanylate cyclase [Dactylosporangium sp.]